MRYLFILCVICSLFYLIFGKYINKLFKNMWIFICNTKFKALPCILKKFPDGFVCVCNETYCDTLEDDKPENAYSFLLITSSRVIIIFKLNCEICGVYLFAFNYI